MLSSFKGRVALAAAVLAAAGTIVVTTLQSHLSEKAATESVVAQQLSLTERIAEDTNDKIRLAQATLGQLASKMPGAGRASTAQLEEFLSEQIGVRPMFQSVQVFDLKGHWVASIPRLDEKTRSTSIADRDWFRDSLKNGGTRVVSSALLSRLSGRPIVVLTFPLYDEIGIMRGLMVATLDLTAEHMLGTIAKAKIGSEGRFVLLSRDGTIVMYGDRDLVTGSVAQLGDASFTIERALHDATLREARAPDQQGVDTLYTFHAIDSADWVLVGMQPYGPALARLHALWRHMLIAGVALSFLLIPMIWLLVSRMLQPLDALRRDIRRLRNGETVDLLDSLQGDGSRELNEVRHEFSTMAQARRAAEIALQREKEMMDVTLHSIGDAVIVTDADSRIRSMNSAAESITGWRRIEAVGRHFSEVFCVADDGTQPLPEDVSQRAIRDKGIANLPPNRALRSKNGREVPVDDSAAPILDEDGVVHGAVVVFRDVGVQRAAAREINWRATHDVLTRLPNRGAFETALETLVAAGEEDAVHAVLMLDLDQFKIVNDTCGHAAGDELLKRVAAMFQSRIRKSDMVARLGGDEFAVLMYHCPGEKAMRLAEELRRAIADMRFTWEQTTFRVGGSIGLVAVDRSYASAMEVQKAADIACYMAKRSGRNRICVHSRDDHQLETMRHEMQAVSRIQSAIDENRLRLYAQHITPVSKSKDSGEHFEVLVRMVDESDNLIPPGAFLPAAERYGLMDEMDRWVIANTAAACAKYFAKNEWRDLDTVCINLSAKTLQDENIGAFIVEALTRHGVPFDRVCLEVTESSAIENLQTSRELIESLRAKGLRFALDDFGVGMTSLAQLRDLPVDVLKIDGSFITGISRDRINSSMVSAIQSLARLMSMETVAERVESPEELIHLQALGVDYAQGYLFSIPAPMEELFGKPGLGASSARAA